MNACTGSLTWGRVRAGTYKTAQSTDACEACPADRYNPNEESASFSECLSCPSGAGTAGLNRQVSIEACKCGDRFYLGVNREGGQEKRRCNNCPIGALSLPNCTFQL